jgi:hypothetical protein
MTMNTLEPMFVDSEAFTLKEEKLGNIDFDQASAELRAATILPGRRCEARMDDRRLCPYEVIEAKEEKSVIIGQGEAFILNQSMGGMLLLIDLAPQAKQLIEVRTRRSGWGWTLNILEARWAKPVQVESLGNLYLVGCRRVFGSCNSLSF